MYSKREVFHYKKLRPWVLRHDITDRPTEKKSTAGREPADMILNNIKSKYKNYNSLVHNFKL